METRRATNLTAVPLRFLIALQTQKALIRYYYGYKPISPIYPAACFRPIAPGRHSIGVLEETFQPLHLLLYQDLPTYSSPSKLLTSKWTQKYTQGN